MTNRAREVLADCRAALKLLEKESDLQLWRVHWAAALALVRAVGHVLDKVDARRNANLNAIQKQRYKLWLSNAKEHEIFREFIEKERNTLLKEYEANTHPLEKVPVAVETTMVPLLGGKPIKVMQVFELDENLFRPLLDGPWAGNDARSVLSSAISWWEKELNLIDALAAREAKQPGPT